MRRPFGHNNGGMGGGLGRGGPMRTAQRSLGTDHFSHSTTVAAGNSSTSKTYKPKTANLLSLSSSSTAPSPYFLINHPISAAPALATWPSCSSLDGSEDFDWECVDAGEFEREIRVPDDLVFGSAPSVDEVHQAVSALQQAVDSGCLSQSIKDRFDYYLEKDHVDGIASPNRTGTELDWVEPSLRMCNSRALNPYGPGKVYDAFHLLQTEPSIQRMVVSLSTDRAVWDAVLNNEAVRELREMLSEAGDGVVEKANGGADHTEAATTILSWIFVNMKAKVMEIIDKVMSLANELFPPPEAGEKAAAGAGGEAGFGEKLRTSFMLSIIVLLIVAVTRADRA